MNFVLPRPCPDLAQALARHPQVRTLTCPEFCRAPVRASQQAVWEHVGGGHARALPGHVREHVGPQQGLVGHDLCSQRDLSVSMSGLIGVRQVSVRVSCHVSDPERHALPHCGQVLFAVSLRCDAG